MKQKTTTKATQHRLSAVKFELTLFPNPFNINASATVHGCQIVIESELFDIVLTVFSLTGNHQQTIYVT